MKIQVEELRFRAGLSVASAIAGDFPAAFASAFERKETEEFEGEGLYRRRKVYRELSKVDEILNTSIKEGLVDAVPVIRRLIVDNAAPVK